MVSLLGEDKRTGHPRFERLFTADETGAWLQQQQLGVPPAASVLATHELGVWHLNFMNQPTPLT